MKKLFLLLMIGCSYPFWAFSQTENNLSIQDKLFGLSQLWKEASYNFAFFDQVPELNWDSCYQDFIPRVMMTENDWDYYLELQKFIALLQDGHTRVFPPKELRTQILWYCHEANYNPPD